MKGVYPYRMGVESFQRSLRGLAKFERERRIDRAVREAFSSLYPAGAVLSCMKSASELRSGLTRQEIAAIRKAWRRPSHEV